MGLICEYSARSFFRHQRNLVIPTVLHYWETYQANVIKQLKAMKDVVWCGDGRFDSMGHSAKYGVYTLSSINISGDRAPIPSPVNDLSPKTWRFVTRFTSQS